MGVRLSGARIQKNWAVFHWNVGPSDKLSAITKIAFKEAICQTLNASPSFKTHIAKSKVHGRHNFSECFEQPHLGQKESSMLNSSNFSSWPFFGPTKKKSTAPPIPPLSKLSFAPLTIKLQPWKLHFIQIGKCEQSFHFASFRFISFHFVSCRFVS